VSAAPAFGRKVGKEKRPDSKAGALLV